MKIFTILIAFFLSFTAFGQNKSLKDNDNFKDSSSFRLSLTTYNHAEIVYDGTTTYVLTDSSLTVKKKFEDGKSKTIYSKSIPKTQTLSLLINKIRLDSLKSFYFNKCVMITSGNEYFLDFINCSTKKHISLHHYYLKQLGDIIQIINSNLPKEYQLQYLTKDTKQDCTFK